ncbi:MAG: cytochrome c oxidase assembly factor Coa1 family protein [Thioalkalispiraceae bacterium]|jgi:hypothetical protein
MENTSGQGKQSAVPNEICGWNWGAFLLNWIWGLGNSTYIALLMFVPLVNLIMPFVLGAKGNAWAWQNRKWTSIEAFKREQRTWSWVAIGLYAGGISFIAGLVFLIGSVMKGSDAYKISLDQVQHNRQVIEVLGEPIEAGFFVGGEVNIQGATGFANIFYNVEGPRAEGTVYVEANKDTGQWIFRKIAVEIKPDKRRIVLVGE